MRIRSNVGSLHVSDSDGDGATNTRPFTVSVYTRAASAKFVQALYRYELGRTASAAEVAFQVGTLDGTGGQAAVASGIASSTEARVRLVANWFQTFLGRTSSPGETSFWGNLLSGQTEERVLSQILGSTEFFSRAQNMGFGGTPDQDYVRALYQILLNRAPSSAEVDLQVNALPQLGQPGVALSLLESVEYRANVVRGYYANLLGRTGSQAEIASYVNSAGDLHALCVGIESSVEFFIVSASKAPTITTFTVPSTGNPGAAVNLSAAANNAAGSSYPLTYTWAITRPDATTFALAGALTSFTPLDSGNYGVSLRVTDEDGFGVSTQASIKVSKPVPTYTVTSATFNYSSPIQSLFIDLSTDVSAYLASTDLNVQNLTTGTFIAPSAMTLTFQHGPEAATLSFTGLPGGTLPNGRYRLTIPSAGNFTFDFFYLAGDVDRDASVGFSDLLLLAQNYGSAASTYAQGDVNRDGVVNFSDLLIVAQNYGTSLNSSPVASASPSLVPVFSTRPIARPR